MIVQPKPDFARYGEWLVSNLSVPQKAIEPNFYQTVVDTISARFESSELKTQLLQQLPEWRDEYWAVHDVNLFTTDIRKIDVNVKPFQSFLDKSFRKNVLLNTNWPEPPDQGWSKPPEWYTTTKDIIRTSFTAKYLDGALFLADRLRAMFSRDRRADVDYEARESGYYAIHVITDDAYNIPDTSLNYGAVRIMFEIQITTQLQEVMRALTHGPYEVERMRRRGTGDQAEVWQWNYKSEKFRPYFVGHILRYIEGAIMEIREKNIKRD